MQRAHLGVVNTPQQVSKGLCAGCFANLLGLLEHARYLFNQRRLVFEHDSGVVCRRRSLGLLEENQKAPASATPLLDLAPSPSTSPLGIHLLDS